MSQREPRNKSGLACTDIADRHLSLFFLWPLSSSMFLICMARPLRQAPEHSSRPLIRNGFCWDHPRITNGLGLAGVSSRREREREREKGAKVVLGGRRWMGEDERTKKNCSSSHNALTDARSSFLGGKRDGGKVVVFSTAEKVAGSLFCWRTSFRVFLFPFIHTPGPPPMIVVDSRRSLLWGSQPSSFRSQPPSRPRSLSANRIARADGPPESGLCKNPPGKKVYK